MTRATGSLTQSFRQALGGLLIAVLLAPLLFGLPSASAASADDALVADLGRSICSPASGQDEDGNRHDEHGGQCQLCLVGCAACCVAAPSEAGALGACAIPASSRLIESAWDAPALRPLPGRVSAPRAPPSLS